MGYFQLCAYAFAVYIMRQNTDSKGTLGHYPQRKKKCERRTSEGEQYETIQKEP